MELLIVTGMSGAGKSQTANALEDMGYYCVDNIPPAIIPVLIELSSIKGEAFNKIAIVTDIRGGELFKEITSVLSVLKNNNYNYKVLFLDCDTDILVNRYKEHRRMHPLSNDNNLPLAEAIEAERNMLRDIRVEADYVIDTSSISISQLKNSINEILLGSTNNTLKIVCKSFGFKYGTDVDADLIFDVRCLPNPFYDEKLKTQTGLSKEVKDYVLSSDESKEFLEKLKDFLDTAVPLYVEEGKSQLTISFGCTGGKHRSVTFAEIFGKHFKQKNYNCVISHRDINK